MRYSELKKKILKLRGAGFYKFKGIDVYFLQFTKGIHHTRYTLISNELAEIPLEDMDYYIEMKKKWLEEKLDHYIESKEWER
jgi:hypothetical protein